MKYHDTLHIFADPSTLNGSQKIRIFLAFYADLILVDRCMIDVFK